MRAHRRRGGPWPAAGLVLVSVVVWAELAQAQAGATLAAPPELRQLIEPEIPPGTTFTSSVAEVIVAIEVTTTGTVSNVRLLEGPGAPFDQAALAAARQFEFSPARLSNGEPVPVIVNFRFRIPKPPPPPPPPEPPAPPVVVRGRVLEKGTRRPIAYAEVSARVDRTMLAEGLTDPDGRFQLEVSTSTFALEIFPSGHERFEESIAAEPGDVTERTIYLAKTAETYETIVRSTYEQREVSKQTISKSVVDKVAGTQGDTLKVIQNLPGVARPSFGGGPPVLRGSAPGDSRTYLEGQEIPAIYHFGGLRSTFNSSFLESVDFIPGNFGPEYGRATGGVIDVRVRNPADDLFWGEVDLNVYDAGFALEGPVTDSFSLGGAFHRSWIDTILPAVIPDDADVSFETAPRYYDYQLIGAWQASKNHEVRGIYYGSMDRLETLFDNPSANNPAVRGTFQSRIMFHNLLVSSEAKVSSRVREVSSIQAGFQEVSFALGDDFFFDLGVWNVSLRSAWDFLASESVTVRVGTDSRLQIVDIALSAPLPPKEGENPPPLSTVEIESVSEQATLIEPGLFTELSWTPVDDLRILPSLRFDYFSSIGRATLDPRLLAEYRIVRGTTLRGGVGLYHQAPEPDESDETIGNPNLLPERSIHASLGVGQTFLPGLTLELTGFYKWLDDQVVRNPELSTNPSAIQYTNDGTGRIFGLEALLRFQWEDRIVGWIAYTFQRSFRTDFEGAEERVFDFDQPHILTALGTWNIGRGWSFGARFRLVSGNPYSPVEGSVYDAYADVYLPIYSQDKARLGTFHQLDLRIDKVWTFDRWNLNLYLDVQNVYNQANPEGLSYSYDFSENEPITGLPILPILGLKGQW